MEYFQKKGARENRSLKHFQVIFKSIYLVSGEYGLLLRFKGDRDVKVFREVDLSRDVFRNVLLFSSEKCLLPLLASGDLDLLLDWRN